MIDRETMIFMLKMEIEKLESGKFWDLQTAKDVAILKERIELIHREKACPWSLTP